jgi:hypothetical protein
MSYNSQNYRSWIATFDLKTLKETLDFESRRTTCAGPQDGVQYTDMEVVQRMKDLTVVIAQKEKDEAARTVRELSLIELQLMNNAGHNAG